MTAPNLAQCFKTFRYLFIPLVFFMLVGCNEGGDSSSSSSTSPTSPTTPTNPPSPPVSESVSAELKIARQMLDKMESGELSPITAEEFAQTDYARLRQQNDADKQQRIARAHRLAMSAQDPEPGWVFTNISDNVILQHSYTEYSIKLEKADAAGNSLGPVDQNLLRIVVALQSSDGTVRQIRDDRVADYAYFTYGGVLQYNPPDEGRMLIGVRPNFTDPAVQALTERWSVAIMVESWKEKAGGYSVGPQAVTFPYGKYDVDLSETPFTRNEIQQKLKKHFDEEQRILFPLVLRTKNINVGDLVSYHIDQVVLAGRVRDVTERDGQRLILISPEFNDVYDIIPFNDALFIEYGIMPETVVYRVGEAIPAVDSEVFNELQLLEPEVRTQLEQERALVTQLASQHNADDSLSIDNLFDKPECSKGQATITVSFDIDFSAGQVAMLTNTLTNTHEASCTWKTNLSAEKVKQLSRVVNKSIPSLAVLNKVLGTEIELVPQGTISLTKSTFNPHNGIGLTVGHPVGVSVDPIQASVVFSSLTDDPGEGWLEVEGAPTLKFTLKMTDFNEKPASVLNWIWQDAFPDLSIDISGGGVLGLSSKVRNAAYVYQKNENSLITMSGKGFLTGDISAPFKDLFDNIGITSPIQTLPSLNIPLTLPFDIHFTVKNVTDDGWGNAAVEIDKPLMGQVLSSFVAPANQQSSVFNQPGAGIQYDINECKASSEGGITAPMVACSSGMMCGTTSPIKLCRQLSLTNVYGKGKNNSQVSVTGKVNLAALGSFPAEPKSVSIHSEVYKITPQYLMMSPGETKNFTATAQCVEPGIYRGTLTATLGDIKTTQEEILECVSQECLAGECDAVWGTHLIMADGVTYDLNATGDFVLARLLGVAGFDVQGRYAPDNGTSWPVAAALQVGQDVVEVHAEFDTPYKVDQAYHYLSVYVNGHLILPKHAWHSVKTSRSVALPDGGLIYVNNLVSDADGQFLAPQQLTVLWPKTHAAKGYSVNIQSRTTPREQPVSKESQVRLIKLKLNRPDNELLKSQERGLLGNQHEIDRFNLSSFIARNGEQVSLDANMWREQFYRAFALTWEVQPGECLFRDGCQSGRYPSEAPMLTPEQRDFGEMACLALTGWYKEACIHDVGLTGSTELVQDYYADSDKLNSLNDVQHILAAVGDVWENPSFNQSFKISILDKEILNNNPATYQLSFRLDGGRHLLKVYPPKDSTARLLPGNTLSAQGSGSIDKGLINVSCGVMDDELASINDTLMSAGHLEVWSINAFSGGAYRFMTSLPLQCLSLNVNDYTLAAGGNSSYLLSKQGKLWSWGSNDYGQLALAEADDASLPTTVMTPVPLVKISAGLHHVLALDNDGKVWGWGDNSDQQIDCPYGQSSYSEPTKGQYIFDNLAEDISAGWYHSLVLDNLGSVWVFNSETPYCTYGTVRLLSSIGFGKNNVKIKQVRASKSYSLALDYSHQVWSWGINDDYQLGLGHTDFESYPVMVPFPESVLIETIATGEKHSLALDKQGQLWGWGANDFGQLGVLNSGEQHAPTPVKILFPDNNITIVAIYAGHNSSFARDNNGELWAWGRNLEGQLGVGDQMNHVQPVKIDLSLLNGAEIREVTSGAEHTLLIDSNNDVYAWGNRAHGVLGDNKAQGYQLEPLLVTGLTSTESVSYLADTISSPISVKHSLQSIGTVTLAVRHNLSNTDPQMLTIKTPQLYFANRQSAVAIPQGRSTEMLYLDMDAVCQVSGKLTPLALQIDDASGNKLLDRNINVMCPVKVDTMVSNNAQGQVTINLVSKNDGVYTAKITGVNGVLINGEPDWQGNLCSECSLEIESQGLCNSATEQRPGNVVMLAKLEVYDPQGQQVKEKSLYCPLNAGKKVLQARAQYSTFIDTQGKLWSWGSDNLRVLGLNNNNLTNEAVQVPGNNNSYKPTRVDVPPALSFVDSAVNTRFSLAVDDTGALWGWGEYFESLYRIVSGESYLEPYFAKPKQNKIFAGDNPPIIRGISSAMDHGLALDSVGNLWMFGHELGSDDTVVGFYTPKQVNFPADKSIKIIATDTSRSNGSLALDDQGRLWYWPNILGQVASVYPELVYLDPSVSAAVGFSLNDSMAVFVDDKHRLWSWGNNHQGQLGLGESLGTVVDQPELVTFPLADVAIMTVSVGNSHSLALDEQGRVWSWGASQYGALGQGEGHAIQSSPELVTFPEVFPPVTIVEISAGTDTSHAIDSEGRIWNWGNGQLLGGDSADDSWQPEHLVFHESRRN